MRDLVLIIGRTVGVEAVVLALSIVASQQVILSCA
jgi:hypothetical protein